MMILNKTGRPSTPLVQNMTVIYIADRRRSWKGEMTSIVYEVKDNEKVFFLIYRNLDESVCPELDQLDTKCC
ncbi:hypothetical protein PsorP6_000636 [Peronosclerospora sorghi]|uniref:Uncharacterized protein n=1 Tax=Peronosclerospora sorghi TaxID=230839 RepID=A0ACC0WQ57_9STRA|nr:hypothetical protein PsorP6_000636 [Peronosclerospora sorghi]